MEEQEDYQVECSVCGQRYINDMGSTECCGALAYLVEDGKATDQAVLFALTPEGAGAVTLKITK